MIFLLNIPEFSLDFGHVLEIPDFFLKSEILVRNPECRFESIKKYFFLVRNTHFRPNGYCCYFFCYFLQTPLFIMQNVKNQISFPSFNFILIIKFNILVNKS